MTEIDNKKMWEVLIRVAKDWTVQDPDTYDYLNGLITLAEIALEEQGLQCNELTGEIVSIEPEPFKIEKGKWYVCIKDFVIGGQKRFYKGNLYISDIDECVTDKIGFQYNSFGSDAAMYFRPATEDKIPYKFKVGDIIRSKFATSIHVTIEEIKNGRYYFTIEGRRRYWKVKNQDCFELVKPRQEWEPQQSQIVCYGLSGTGEKLSQCEAYKEYQKEELTEFERSLKNVLEETLETGDTHNLKADSELLLSVARKQFIEEAWKAE